MSDAIAEMKYHQGGSVFCFDDVPIQRIVREYNRFNKIHKDHLKFMAAINGKKLG